MNRYEEEFLICAYSLENGLLAEENLGLFPGREGEREAPRVRPVSYTYWMEKKLDCYVMKRIE